MSSSGSPDSLAEALSEMADGESKPRDGATGGASVEDASSSFEWSGTEGSSDAGCNSREARASGRPRRPSGLARLGVRVSLVIGMLLLIPAIWGVLVLSGVEVYNAEASGAKPMALLMLICWPVGVVLLWGAFHFHKQVCREQEAYDRAKGRGRGARS